MDSYKMIDVNDINRFVSLFITLIKNFLGYVLGSAKKYFIVTIVVFLGVMATYIYNDLQQAKFYESTMACIFHQLNFKIYGEMTDNLNKLISTKSYNSLAAELNISLEEARSIKSFEGRDINGKLLSSNQSPDIGEVYFLVKTTDNGVFKHLEKGLVDYLANSALQNRIRTTDIPRLNKKIEFQNRDLELVDSVITAYSSFLKKIPSSVKDTATSVPGILSLLNYKEQLEDKKMDNENTILKIQQPIEAIYGFPVPDEPKETPKGSLAYMIVISLVISFFASAFLRLFLSAKPDRDMEAG